LMAKAIRKPGRRFEAFQRIQTEADSLSHADLSKKAQEIRPLGLGLFVGELERFLKLANALVRRPRSMGETTELANELAGPGKELEIVDLVDRIQKLFPGQALIGQQGNMLYLTQAGEELAKDTRTLLHEIRQFGARGHVRLAEAPDGVSWKDRVGPRGKSL